MSYDDLPDNAKLWVDALRSDEYSQTKNYLRKDDGFCCLGVGSDLAVKNGVDVKVKVHDHGIYTYDGASGTLPGSVMDWLGLRTDNGTVCVNDDNYSTVHPSLSIMNDRGDSFTKIADHIIEYQDQMFKKDI